MSSEFQIHLFTKLSVHADEMKEFSQFFSQTTTCVPKFIYYTYVFKTFLLVS